MKLVFLRKSHPKKLNLYSLNISRVMVFVLSIVFLLNFDSSILAQESNIPKILEKDGREVLILPDRLSESIKTNFPDFRVPTAADLVGPWRIEKKPGSFPFVVWGDFNGDNFGDVVILLINEKQWKSVIFHGTAQGYLAANVVGGNYGESILNYPQEAVYQLVKKGEEVVVESHGGSTSSEFTISQKYKFKFDAIKFYVYEKSLYLIYWENGKYETVSIVN